jgi:hypothetical protein
MAERSGKHDTEPIKKEKKKQEEELPFCTSAPSAEHARGMEFEEPCDDGRSGEYQEDDLEK